MRRHGELAKQKPQGTDMTRLDIFIARVVSQKYAIEHGLKETAHIEGPVFELGLGNGRTFDHLRALAGAKNVYVFERNVASNPASTPDENMLVLGDIAETLPRAVERIGAKARLVHADMGGHDLKKNDEFARFISPLIVPVLAPGGILISSDKMYHDDWECLPLPFGAKENSTFLYRNPECAT